MRLISLITAAIVALALYGVVFERDRLIELAGGSRDAPAEEVSEEVAAAPEADSPNVAEEPASVVSVVVLESIASDVDNGVILRGQTEALRDVNVMAQISGLVISEPLRKGYFVAKDEVLCKIDPGTRPAQLSEAEARLAEAMISDTAASRLAEGGFGSETRAAAAAATLQAAEAGIDRAQTEIGRLTIKAPFDGLLESDTAELGSLMQPGSSCATVLQLDPIKLVAYLPETAVDLVKSGASATARLSSGRVVTGEVSFLSRSADQSTRTFRVEIMVENSDLSIRDGQTADISIAAEGVAAHLIPSSALTLNNDGTMGVRIVDENETAQFMPVSIVTDTADGIFVDGLPESARIIVVGQEFVTDGVAVRAVARSDAS